MRISRRDFAALATAAVVARAGPALAADPDEPLSDEAVPIGVHLASLGPSLPLWYMPPALSRGGRRWKAPFVIAVVAAFLLIDAMGLCNTYGVLGL